jgi:hypothetical protein
MFNNKFISSSKQPNNNSKQLASSPRILHRIHTLSFVSANYSPY